MRTITKIKAWILAFALGTCGSVSAIETGLLNLVTDQQGLYRLSHEALMAQGINLSGLRHDRITIKYAGDSVPVFTRGRLESDGSYSEFFGAGGVIEFYAPGADSLYTDEQVFSLHIDRLGRNGVSVIDASTPTGGSVADSYMASAVYAPQNTYIVSGGNVDDPWAIQLLRATGSASEYNTNIDLPGLLPQGEVQVRFEVWGQSFVDETPDHRVDLLVNGESILADIASFDGIISYDLSGTVDAADLQENGNTVSVQLPLDQGAPIDQIALNELEIKYPRPLQAIAESLTFETDADEAAVSGFTNEDISVFRVHADGSQEKLIAGVSEQADGLWQARFATGTGTYYLSGADTALVPLVEYLPARDDIRSGDAQYLIIAHGVFINGELDRLVNHRLTDYSVKVVDVAQIYSQFGNNRPDPEAIHDYIRFAADQLGTEMVLLVGGDSYDYKGYVGNSVSYIPTIYKPVDGGTLVINHAPVDALYGDLDGDNVPDIPIGRLPLREAAELPVVVDKIIAYDTREKVAGAVFAADMQDVANAYSFTEAADELIASLPTSWQASTTTVYADDYTTTGSVNLGDARDALVDQINQGIALTAFIGHSSLRKWSNASPALLDTQDVAGLLNDGTPTVVTQWGCWNTYYVSPAGNTLGQIMLVDGAHGAAAALGSSTLTRADAEKNLGKMVYNELFTPGISLGEAVINAKQQYAALDASALDVLIGWQILGDPALVIQPE